MIELSGVTKKYGSQKVLHKFSISIKADKTTSIIGASGSGKSTIFRILAGLESIDTGQMTLEGKEVNHLPPSKFGYIIQDGGLFPHLKADANIELVAKLKGVSIEERKERMEELSKLLSLPTSLLSKFPRQLSGGQKQRVALARGVFMDPKILLLDEPLGALDPIMKHELQQELKEIFKTLKKTVLLITHDLKEAAFLGDIIHLIYNGQILQSGSLLDFCKHPKDDYVKNFTKAYMLGEPTT